MSLLRLQKRSYGRGAIYWGGAFSSCGSSHEETILAESNWIWYPEGSPERSAPVAERYFRRNINVDKSKTLVSARAAITADNSFSLFINGNLIVQGDNFNEVKEANIKRFLHKGDNVIAVMASNVGQGDNPAGLIAALELRYNDGSVQNVYTDGSWLTSREGSPDWQRSKHLWNGWENSSVLGEFSMSPWRMSPKKPLPGLYPDYEDTVALLQQNDISEDFSSSGPIRYGHRTSDDFEIYFLSNKTAASVKAECSFRTELAEPQLWNPVTGKVRLLPKYTIQNGLTTIPMEFDPYQSFFVVFPRKLVSAKSDSTIANFPRASGLKNIEGDWNVSFDPSWGGPANVTFDQLYDWTQSSERGIKYYSGIATYSKDFACPAGIKQDSSIYLDLGVVHDIARVRLNGIDLGVVWCAPWRVDISNALKNGTNKLEIEIANRWPNRIIGDQQPPDSNVRTLQWQEGYLEKREFKTGRYTFATGPAHNQLLPSGLLGPVRLVIYR